jgi:hypothetical protein
MKIELFYFDGCPSWQMGLRNLKSALQLEGIKTDVQLVKVLDDVGAVKLKFLGSPSFRVDDKELWPEEREMYTLSCRVYPSPQGIKGWPSVEMLQEKLHVLKEGSK